MNYEGWSNRETYILHQWIEIEGGIDFTEEEIKEGINKEGIACILKDHHSEMVEKEMDHLKKNLLETALNNVNWVEIVESYIPLEESKEERKERKEQLSARFKQHLEERKKAKELI